MRITAIERQPRRQRANLFVDSRFALALPREVIADAGLRVGDDVTPERLEALREAGVRHAALASALRLLSYRPRSEAELRQRLARRGSPPAIVDETIERLRELALVDDEAFARSWVESRDQISPRGRRLLAAELRAKGVARQTALDALTPVDDAEASYRAGERKARLLRGLEYSEFRRRLGDFLLRRGFSYDIVRSTAARLWEEVGHSRAEDAEG